MTLPTKPCVKCGVEKPLTAFVGRQRSCRDCSTKARREKAAESPGAAEKRARRPRVEHTEELAQRVLDALAEGATLSEIALTPGMPQLRDVARWRSEVIGFEAAYIAARATRADARVDAIAKNVQDMRAGSLDVNTGKAVNDSLRWLAGKDKPSEYGDAKPLIDARSVTLGGASMTEESPFETARWLTHLLHGTVRAAALPPTGTKPEVVTAMRVEIEKLLGRPVTDAELQEALDDPRWRDVLDRVLAMIEGREPRPLPSPPAPPSHTAAQAQPIIEDAQIIDPNPWRHGVAAFDAASGRLVAVADPRVVGLARGNGRTVLLPDGNRTTFVAGETDAVIEERLASWYRDREMEVSR